MVQPSPARRGWSHEVCRASVTARESVPWTARGSPYRVTINTGPGTRGPGTQGPEDRGPKDQGPNDLALLHLAFMTEMQLVSMF